MNRAKSYRLINHLIKQYDRLHAEAIRTRNNHNFREASNIDVRASWLLAVGDNLLDTLSKEGYLIPSEKVQFD
jgi:hypothetical protein